MTVKSVVFDLDGTLLDSLEDLASSMNRVLVSRGFPPHRVDDYKKFVGDGALMLVQRALPESNRSKENIESLKNCFEEDYGENWKVHTQLYPGISEMLDRLSVMELRLGVLSNKPQKITLATVNHFLHKKRFIAVFGQRQGVPKKPDPSVLFEMAELMKIDVNHIVYVGDSGVDMQLSCAAGCQAVGVEWGLRTRDELIETGANHLISEPYELFPLLQKLIDQPLKDSI